MMDLITFFGLDSFNEILIKKVHLNFREYVRRSFVFVSLSFVINSQGFFFERETFSDNCDQIKFIHNELTLFM